MGTPTVTGDPLLDQICAALGMGALMVGDAISQRHCADAMNYPPVRPRAVVLPRSTEDVATVLRLCHAASAPMVVQGGMTGLAGGAHPCPGEIALSLDRMRGVEEIDPACATLTALAGTPLQEVQDAAEAAGFLCGIDLGSRGSCTIGGNIATNAGGNQVLRYGMARRNVLGLEVVEADGTILRGLNKMLKNNAGYDWTQLYIGSEGTLGVVTRVVLGLHPRPQGIETALCAVPDMASAFALLSALERRFGGGLMVFEGMWREFIANAVGLLARPEPFGNTRPEICVLTEVAMGPGGGDGFSDALAALMDEGVITDARIARSQAERALFWSYRESPYDYARIASRFVNFDVSVPRDRMGAVVDGLRDLGARHWPDAPQAIFGHIADSNLHLIVPLAAGDTTKPHDVEAAVYGLVAGAGGSVSAEHGIGMSKRGWLALSRSAEELALMRKMKAALDPKGILNPGRVLG